jgi:hypothetical protein
MDRLGPCLSQALVKFGGYYPYNLRSGLLLMSQMVCGSVSSFKQDSDDFGSWTSLSTYTLEISSTATSNQTIFFSVTLAETELRNYT